MAEVRVFGVPIKLEPIEGAADPSMEDLPGLTRMGPIRLSGFFRSWDDCVNCGATVPHHVDQPVVNVRHHGVFVGVLCDACGVALLADEGDA